jgi:hypothetical protein
MDSCSCAHGLDHCHGTLIVHDNGDLECTDVCADLDEVRHDTHIACTEVVGGCTCAHTGELARAS